MKNKVLIIGNSSHGSLERSYENAFNNLGFQTELLSPEKLIKKYIPLYKIGALVNTFLEVLPWQKKGNREIVLYVKEHDPDIILIFCNTRILLGSLAFIKSISKGKIVLVWPDTLFNLTQSVTANLVFFDFVASYSKTAIPVFNNFTSKNVGWIPLAADQSIHLVNKIPESFTYDISFVGGWRPERQHILELIKKHFPTLKILIKGPEWLRRCKSKLLKSSISDGGAVGHEFARIINSSRINLNIIDETNYPAANMRFFEIPIAYGFQLSSACPEFESEFIDGEHIAYYHTEDELLYQVNKYMKLDSNEMNLIRKKAHTLVLEQHTYLDRINKIIEKISI